MLVIGCVLHICMYVGALACYFGEKSWNVAQFTWPLVLWEGVMSAFFVRIFNKSYHLYAFSLFCIHMGTLATGHLGCIPQVTFCVMLVAVVCTAIVRSCRVMCFLDTAACPMGMSRLLLYALVICSYLGFCITFQYNTQGQA